MNKIDRMYSLLDNIRAVHELAPAGKTQTTVCTMLSDYRKKLSELEPYVELAELMVWNAENLRGNLDPKHFTGEFPNSNVYKCIVKIQKERGTTNTDVLHLYDEMLSGYDITLIHARSGYILYYQTDKYDVIVLIDVNHNRMEVKSYKDLIPHRIRGFKIEQLQDVIDQLAEIGVPLPLKKEGVPIPNTNLEMVFNDGFIIREKMVKK